MNLRPADPIFLAIEVGSWATIGLAIFKRDAWSRLDAYWLWVGSPLSVVASAIDGLWLYAAAWLVWIPALLAKRIRRRRP